jgi:GntR family transcriptional regulator
MAEEVVEASVARADESHLLGIKRGHPVFVVTRTSYDYGGRPVEYVKSTYRGDRYKFVNRLTRPAGVS